ncbi:hypothetical protein BDR26DRAFT_922364 [Obelidium mucronatum]|nr:hypothetical protein BDR26DRAFT_922364 [Obelidium mucronatum]
MFAPFASDWSLTDSQIEAAQALAVKDGLAVDCSSKLRLFLYAKGILSTKKSLVRKSEFDDVLSNDTEESSQQLKRLKTIVEGGEKSPTRTALQATPKLFFDAFVASHPEWAATAGVFVAHRDHPDLQGKEHALVERFQKSGHCYMHAPVVLQHYLVAMSTCDKTPILDIAEFLKKNMSGSALYHHIWEGKGGDSLDFLKRILATKPDPADILHESNLILANLTELLKLYGPGLISGFGVTASFNSNEWRHVGKYKGMDFIGRHAMVLIGSRQEKDKTYYLMQNWWKKKAYVEVDAEYLLRSEATIHFIKEKQLKMGEFPTSFEQLVECENGLDASENFLLET